MFIWSTGISGGTKIEFELAKLLAASGYKVKLVCLGSKRHSWFNFKPYENNIEFLYLEPDVRLPFVGRVSIYGMIDSLRKLLKIPYEPDRIRYLAERIPTDCDIYIATYFPTAIALQLSYVKGRKVYFVQDSPALALENEGAYGLKMFALSLQLPFDAFICNSNYTRSIVSTFNPRARVFVGGIGINTKIFKPKALNTDVQVTNKRDSRKKTKFTALVILRKQRVKGPDATVSVLNDLAKKLPLHVLVVGEDPRKLSKVKPEFVFTLYRNIPPYRMGELYRSADLFLFTSYVESFGLPPLEAMASGTPVVMTDAKGTRDYAVNGYNAIVLPPGAVSEIAEAAYQVLTDEDLRLKLIEGGLKTARMWSWDVRFPNFENILKTILTS